MQHQNITWDLPAAVLERANQMASMLQLPLSDILTRTLVNAAARHRCRYCLTDQKVSGGQMHTEHIIPLSKGGTSEYLKLVAGLRLVQQFQR